MTPYTIEDHGWVGNIVLSSKLHNASFTDFSHVVWLGPYSWTRRNIQNVGRVWFLSRGEAACDSPTHLSIPAIIASHILHR